MADIQPWMIKEAYEEVMIQREENPQGHPDDWRREAAVTIALEAFPNAPHSEQMDAADAIRRRMGSGDIHDSGGSGVPDDFDFGGL